MKRRDFIKKGTTGAVSASMIPLSGINTNEEGEDRKSDNWHQVATGKKGTPIRKKDLEVDVLVVGGGVAGCCAAVSAARNGAKKSFYFYSDRKNDPLTRRRLFHSEQKGLLVFE